MKNLRPASNHCTAAAAPPKHAVGPACLLKLIHGHSEQRGQEARGGRVRSRKNESQIKFLRTEKAQERTDEDVGRLGCMMLTRKKKRWHEMVKHAPALLGLQQSSASSSQKTPVPPV